MSEFSEQREVVAWFRKTWPEHAMSIRLSMNGINLGGGVKAARIIKQMKSQGMVVGESDLALLLPKGGYGCLLIEHKSEEDTNGASESQLDYAGYHNMIGNLAVFTKGVDDMKKVIQEYMGL